LASQESTGFSLQAFKPDITVKLDMIRGILVALAVVASAESDHQEMKPVEKVIGLIEKLQAETEQEGVEEAAGYDKFACFCKKQAEVKLKSIADAEASLAKLSAKIKKRSSEITQMDSSVQDSNKEIKKLKKECEEEAKVRSDDHHEFTIKKNDIVQAIAGTEGAIEMMEASKAASFLQMKPVASKVSKVIATAIERDAFHPKTKKQAALLTALMELDDKVDQDPAQAKMDAAMGSKFHSNEIIESLMSILKDFKVQKNEIETSEADKKHTFDMAQASRMNQLKSFEDQVARSEEIIASKEEDKNQCEKDKASTEADKEADETFLEELVKECEKTAESYDARSKSRSKEMAALAEALTILKGKVAETYGANKKLNLLSTEDGNRDDVSKLANAEGHWVWEPDFLQVESDSRLAGVDATTSKVVKYLSKKAKSLQSASLSTLMLKIKADHFVKVRTMIKDLIGKLEADAEAEQDQKGWCDEEMEKATSKRDENIGAMEGDLASITKTSANIDQLDREIAKLEVEIADLYKALNEATDLRKAEKATNEKTISDATAGLNAVKAAIKVLKDFYDSSLIQTSAKVGYKPPKGDADGNTVGDLAPDTGFSADEGNKGGKDAATGILGLMAVIQSNFEGTIEATEGYEKEAAKEFDTFKSDSEGDIDEKKSAVEEKSGSHKTAKADLVDYKDDLKNHGDLKKEALDELAKLKPACVGTGMDYAERVARREQEIESLKNAYMIFDDMSLLEKSAIKRH
jgi:uncharacterized coiled-coil DUF342 family protein